MAERTHLTVAEVAAALGIPKRTVYFRLEQGYMVGEHVSPRLWLAPRAELERWKGRGKLPRGRYADRNRRDKSDQPIGPQDEAPASSRAAWGGRA